VLGYLLGPRRPDAEKDSPYECGFAAFESARLKFDVRYYLVAILFIIFDLEIAFLFPWAVVLEELGMFGFWAMVIFLGILSEGISGAEELGVGMTDQKPVMIFKRWTIFISLRKKLKAQTCLHMPLGTGLIWIRWLMMGYESVVTG
jgi:NADH:ubiquinone oxidoreductase subunit 3 (subunit A)